MANHETPLSEALVQQIHELSCTPFTLAAFRERWNVFGWSYKSNIGDEYGFRVRVAKGLSLNVDPVGSRIVGASLPFYYWEQTKSRLHMHREEYKRQLGAFDASYKSTLKLTERVLGQPFLTWRDSDKDAHKAAVWEGNQGLLILQQAAFDPQFGIELNFWLTSCNKQKFKPKSPLIGWLCKRSERIHEQKDFPPLIW